jgi:SPP1 family predicted phage head-tail adaptor
MKPLNIGRMDRRITLQMDGVQIGTDPFNDPILGEPLNLTVWASKEDIKDGERYAAQEVGAEVTTRFRIRWSDAVKNFDPRGRVLFDGRTYSISAVKELGRREGLEITAAARAERV